MTISAGADGAPHRAGKVVGIVICSGTDIASTEEETSCSVVSGRSLDVQSCSLTLNAASLAIVAEFIGSLTSGRAAIPATALRCPTPTQSIASPTPDSRTPSSESLTAVSAVKHSHAKLSQLTIAVDVGSGGTVLPRLALTAAGLAFSSSSRLLQVHKSSHFIFVARFNFKSLLSPDSFTFLG